MLINKIAEKMIQNMYMNNMMSEIEFTLDTPGSSIGVNFFLYHSDQKSELIITEPEIAYLDHEITFYDNTSEYETLSLSDPELMNKSKVIMEKLVNLLIIKINKYVKVPINKTFQIYGIVGK